MEDIYYFDREKKVLCKENVLGGNFINWAYLTRSGKIFQPFLYKCGFLSAFLGVYFDSCFSKSKIKRTVEDLKIDTAEILKEDLNDFHSFNDFFYRKLKPSARPFELNQDEICCPADGRILVYPEITPEMRFPVKGAETRLEELCGAKMTDFDGGSVVVVRLCPADYHRFHFPCDGKVVSSQKIRGEYHSVNPVALNVVDNVFVRNKREVSIIDTVNFGKITYLEVGAFGVAGIEQTYRNAEIKKMQEKGYFKFGGSTVVLVFQKNKITFSADLLEKSAEGIEVLVKVGQPLGFKK